MLLLIEYYQRRLHSCPRIQLDIIQMGTLILHCQIVDNFMHRNLVEMKIIIKNLITVTIFFWVISSSVFASNQFPEELDLVAKQLDCQSVPGFFERPGMVEPPYLYGYLPGLKEESAAFWCYQISGEKFYILALVNKGKLIGQIKWGNYPGGLSVSKEIHMPLSDFMYVDNAEKKGPCVVTDYGPIQSEYDGVITYFYQYNGKWLYKILH